MQIDFADFLSQTNQDLEWPVVVQSWVNVYRKGQGIDWHNHHGWMGKSFSANIFRRSNKTWYYI